MIGQEKKMCTVIQWEKKWGHQSIFCPWPSQGLKMALPCVYNNGCKAIWSFNPGECDLLDKDN